VTRVESASLIGRFTECITFCGAEAAYAATRFGPRVLGPSRPPAAATQWHVTLEWCDREAGLHRAVRRSCDSVVRRESELPVRRNGNEVRECSTGQS